MNHDEVRSLYAAQLVAGADRSAARRGSSAAIPLCGRGCPAVTEILYKVSGPSDDWTFEPRRFWRTQDWSFSDDMPRDGLVEDSVLYAGSFDEVNIHLLPPVWRLRVWLDDEARCERLRTLGFCWAEGTWAVIFAAEADRDEIESFSPTVYTFERSGFEQTPTNEFVSRERRTCRLR